MRYSVIFVLSFFIILQVIGFSVTLFGSTDRAESLENPASNEVEATLPSPKAPQSGAFSVADRTQIEQTFNQIPIYFTENRGQTDEEVHYYVQGTDKTLYFTSSGIIFSLTGKYGDEERRWVVKLDFVGANPDVQPEGKGKQNTIVSYFKGKPEDWKTGCSTYRKIVYENVWPGIDLFYSGTVNKLKYEFIVKPGSDPSVIQLSYRGVSDVSVVDPGLLQVHTPIGSFVDGEPYAYQLDKRKTEKVNAAHRVQMDHDKHIFTIGFDLGEYDPRLPLIIDPVLVMYCGYIGGIEGDEGLDISVDSNGYAYICGKTTSDEMTFPVDVGPDLFFNGEKDVFVAKIDPDGMKLVYCGYIGGNNEDSGYSIAVDHQGCAYVTGCTSSDDSSFPVKDGPDISYNGNNDAFVAKVCSDGSDLVYCGYIGGAGTDIGSGIAVGASGCAYITGLTESPQGGFPVVNGPDLTFNGDRDAFVAKVATNGKGLVYCGYIGGTELDEGNEIAIDNENNAYIAGFTTSSQTSFPVKNGPDLTHNGDRDAFVAKVRADGSALDYCGYIGGNEIDEGFGISVYLKHAFVTGRTKSDETTFPVLVGPDMTFNDGGEAYDGFVAKLHDEGTSLDYCGYIGGSHFDICTSIDVDYCGRSYVTGLTYSNESSFPVKLGPCLVHSGGPDEAFVAKINSKGDDLVYCGYIGGDAGDYGHGIGVDTIGRAYVTGTTTSTETTFPVKGGPDLTFNGTHDAFVAKITMALSADGCTLSAGMGGIINFYLYAGKENANRWYMILGSITGTDPGTPLPGGQVTLPINWDAFTNIVIDLVNTPFFENFLGQLDSEGSGTATFNTYGPLPAEFVGSTLNFAYALNKPYDFVSNPVAIEVVP